MMRRSALAFVLVRNVRAGCQLSLHLFVGHDALAVVVQDVVLSVELQRLIAVEQQGAGIASLQVYCGVPGIDAFTCHMTSYVEDQFNGLATNSQLTVAKDLTTKNKPVATRTVAMPAARTI